MTETGSAEVVLESSAHDAEACDFASAGVSVSVVPQPVRASAQTAVAEAKAANEVRVRGVVVMVFFLWADR